MRRAKEIIERQNSKRAVITLSTRTSDELWFVVVIKEQATDITDQAREGSFVTICLHLWVILSDTNKLKVRRTRVHIHVTSQQDRFKTVDISYAVPEISFQPNNKSRS